MANKDKLLRVVQNLGLRRAEGIYNAFVNLCTPGASTYTGYSDFEGKNDLMVQFDF